jgi:hypothetical protein
MPFRRGGGRRKGISGPALGVTNACVDPHCPETTSLTFFGAVGLLAASWFTV